jgi:hypothetical protein
MSSEQLLAALDAASVRCLTTLIHFLWQGSAVALGAGCALFCLRQASAALRYRVTLAGLVLMALCPIGTYLLLERPPVQSSARFAPVRDELPALRGNALVVAPEPLPKGDAAPAQPPTSVPPEMAASPPPESVPALDEPRWRRWAPLAAGIYLTGVLLLLARLTLGLHGGRRLCRQARAVTDALLLAALDRQARALGLRASPLLAVCRQVAVPTVVGILRPTILLPLAIATGLTPHELETILAHELAHLRRYDPLVNLLQRLIEAYLFFHPAVWWISRRIRIEREHCCDDLVVALGAEPSLYAASLLHVAELAQGTAGAAPALEGLHAVRAPSPLRRRVARLLGVKDEPPLRLLRAWPLVATAVLASLLILPAFRTPGTPIMTTQAAPAEPAGTPAWGEASGGLRARLVAVAPNTDEQKPTLAAGVVTRFARAEDVTFLVELKNVGDKALSLQGTRYGDAVTQPWPGKSASDQFAPVIFDCEFFDKNGKLLDQPARTRLDTDVMLLSSGGLAETVAPGQSLLCLIRPTRWTAGMARLLVPGEYRARIHYRGPTPGALQEIKRHWPDNAMSGVWTGDVASGQVAFTIPDAPENRRPELVWGPSVKGLQAAVELQSAARTPQAVRDTAAATYPHGSRLQVQLHVKNGSNKDISFWSETWRQDDQVLLLDAAGKETALSHAWYSGWAAVERRTLKPGQVAVLSAIDLGIAATAQAEKEFDHPIGGVIAGKPGPYRLRYELRFNSWLRKGKDGQPIPGKDDWQGTLSTGVTALTVRERRAEDEAPSFTARLRFRSADGKPIETGQVEVYRQSGMRSLLKDELKPGPFEVPRCPHEALLVDVRAPGYEETRLYDVAVEPARETVLSLKPAEPLRFRLVTRTGEPVAGAKVRRFNRSKADAGTGPYPQDGLHGPVWATSNAAGDVVLDSLQKFDPLDRKLGNNIYWFYVEPPNLAPFFIGPVQAGADLGNLTVSPYLEVRGEVRGTPAELAAFAAEWDQPVAMKRGNGEVGWYYAESKPLQTKRAGDKLTFQLTGLHPGTLRIVSRFQRGGKPISHEYSKRSPNEDDVVYEVELTESRNDLVVTNKSSETKKR